MPRVQKGNWGFKVVWQAIDADVQYSFPYWFRFGHIILIQLSEQSFSFTLGLW